MPDITYLPVMAEYFKVSIDQLMGILPLNGEEYIAGNTDTGQFWENKLEYLLRTRKSAWNSDYTVKDYEVVDMLNGIIIMGLNGCGKSTVCRELAQRLGYKRIDVEDYYFLDSEIPYTVSRSREEVQQMILEDINKYKNYVFCSVNCYCDSKITDTFQLAVLLSAPLEVRMERIKQREITRFGERVLEGGDMYESQKKFHTFVALRSAEE